MPAQFLSKVFQKVCQQWQEGLSMLPDEAVQGPYSKSTSQHDAHLEAQKSACAQLFTHPLVNFLFCTICGILVPTSQNLLVRMLDEFEYCSLENTVIMM
jgi:hypothetical protein